jgi:hypothetical protein
MTGDRQIPNSVFSGLLFFQRVERNIRREQDRVCKLLHEQMALLKERKALLDDIHCSVMERWNEEENPTPEIAVLLPASEWPPV